jgi:Ca-activated chloride channel family protein
MKNIKYLLCFILLLPAAASAWQWADLWLTPDQRAGKLLQTGKPKTAARVFKNRNWQGVANYRAGNYTLAFKEFSANKSSDGQYNAGNAAAFMGNYQDAITAYDKAIALNSNNNDAITNRDIVKKLLQQQKQQQKQQDNSNSSKNAKNNSQQNSEQQNQAEKKQDSKNQQTRNNPQNQSGNSPQKSTTDPQNITAQTSKQQRQDEDSKQLLRRLADDPGGLLQQKFLRDYTRRHGTDDQGVS